MNVIHIVTFLRYYFSILKSIVLLGWLVVVVVKLVSAAVLAGLVVLRIFYVYGQSLFCLGQYFLSMPLETDAWKVCTYVPADPGGGGGGVLIICM